MATDPKKSQPDLSDLYEQLEELREEIRDNRRGGAGRRRRGPFPPFVPMPPPAMVAWLASWLFSPRRGDRDYDWYEAIRRFADTRDDFWDRFDDCAYDSAEAVADIFHQFANATGRDRRRREHPRIDMDALEKKLAGMDEGQKQEVLESVRRVQRLNELFERGRRNNKDEE
jgi:hypothetical protein